MKEAVMERTLIAYGDYKPWGRITAAYWQNAAGKVWGPLYAFRLHKYTNVHLQAAQQIDLNGKTLEDTIKEIFPGWTIDQALLNAGTYYPRIHRTGPILERYGETIPYVEDTPFLGSFVNSLEQIEGLFESLAAIFRVVHPAKDNNLNAYGGAIRDIIILACTEVEAQWKGVLEAHCVVPAKGKHFTTNDYVKLLPVMKLDQYEVKLTRYPRIIPTGPFIGWKASNPTGSLPWYDAYNKVKHDREVEFNKATLEHAIEAVAACVVMLAAQFGIQALERHRLKSLFEFYHRPIWDPKEWYYQPVQGPDKGWGATRYPI
jgi:hypothetical protein